MPLTAASEIAAYFSEQPFAKIICYCRTEKFAMVIISLTKALPAPTHDLEGNDVTTAFYPGNQIVCELYSFFKRVPSSENIQAITACTAWCISFADLQTVFHTMPQFREFARAVLVNAYAGLKTRMLATLHETTEERYSNLMDSLPGIFQHAPLKYIASYLG